MKKIFLFMISVLGCSLAAIAGPHNIAPYAKIEVVSQLNDNYKGENLVDGLIGIADIGEWASTSGSTSWGAIDYPWVRLVWDKPQSINRITLFDRASLTSHTAGVTLHFEDGSQVFVNSILNDGTARTVDFPTKVTRWVKVEVTDGDGLNLGFSEIEVFPSPEQFSDYVSKVDPYVESARARYFTVVPGNRPFGMIAAAPMTRNKNQYGGGYNYNSREVLGFPQVHCWMLGGVNLMPTSGNINPALGEEKWKSKFMHEGEIIQPGYQRLFLNDYKIWVELTSTDRVSFYKFRYTEDNIANVLLNLGGITGNCTMNKADVQKVSNTEIVGSVNTTGRFWGGPDNVKVFFVMRFEKPFEKMQGWNEGENFTDITTLKGSDKLFPRNADATYSDSPAAGVSAVYNVKKGEEIQVKMSISYTSVENARLNMDTECNHWDFEAVKNDSYKEWNEWLSKIDVEGGTNEQQIKFYTDLWHVLKGRHKLDDVSGDYPDYMEGELRATHTINAKLKVRTLPKDENGKVKFHMYNSDAFWLSQWNLNVLWGLAWPEVLDDFAACLVQYGHNGGEIPRGPIAGAYSYIMTSCPGVNLITAAYQKNMLTKVDAEVAYKAMAKSMKPGGMIGPKKEMEFYQSKGYYPGNAGITLEAAFQYWAMSEMATKMGKSKDAAFYKKQSAGWQKLYNPEQKLIFPKDASGKWLHNDALSGNGWVEANAWQATWSVSHGIPQLAKLMGGNDVLCDKLNFAFEQSESQDFVYGYSNGYISYANQPGCSNAHVFNYAGAPWLTQYWVRKVKEQAYGAITPDRGYGGHDEDQGQMGGVSALMAIGLFSLQGTSSQDPVYEITSPVFDKVTIKLNPDYYKGREFQIKVHNNSKENCYIQKAELNKKIHNDFKMKHSDYEKGGLLELWLGDKPNTSWGVSE